MTMLKLTQIGNSVGMILPRELLGKLGVGKGDTLYAIEQPDGIRLTTADPEFEALFERAEFVAPAAEESRRAVIVVDVERIADSCGYGVPLMSYDGKRPHMEAWAEKKLRVGGAAALEEYKAEKNSVSIDGLPAL